ncbi:MAG TPA: mycofactocin-associated electron transfer flavoprotein alpha subunit [Ilumatobacteraceae bacterium]|nr:mycofactocin-associated electron transfer flavoprotein alpha subunit [Ilumatobacteraceae bacterium]
MLAVIVVRDGIVPAGAGETISECDGRAALVGSGTAAASLEMQHTASQVTTFEVGDFHPGAGAEALAAHFDDEPILVLPASPDGRDFAPRLAAQLQRPLYAMCMGVSPSRVDQIRHAGTELHSIEPPAAFVATLQPGVRGADHVAATATATSHQLIVADTSDPRVEQVLPADAATIDLSEADRIVAGGAGLDATHRFDQLAALGSALRASVGATRVITDRGWIGHERQIGTTGVIVDPQLYIAFGISGAVQHTSGLGQPQHVISINTDPHCPMMQLADLAVVADANAVLDQLLLQLGVADG